MIEVDGRLYTLQEREWLSALHAAMVLAKEAEEKGVPFPAEALYPCWVETWDGVIANLMAMCHAIWEEARRR